MVPRTADAIANGVVRAGLAGLGLLLTAKMYSTLVWRIEHDTPLLHYAAFLMNERGAMPYRDVFETSMPGTFVFHSLVGKLFGFSDFAFRCVDLGLLSCLLAVTFLFMSRFGKQVAVASAIAFGLVYLSHGQTMSLQRDYIGILPVALALLCLPGESEEEPASGQSWRFATIGFLYGLSTLVKPHLCVSLPVVFGSLRVALQAGQRAGVRGFFADAALCAAGFLVPLAAATTWLAMNSALEPFATIVLHYLPMHNSMTGCHQTLPAHLRTFYLIDHTLRLGGYGILIVAALFGIHTTLAGSDRRRSTAVSAVCLLLCMILYCFYATVAGKFWDYHWMPLAYFCSLSAALCLDTRGFGALRRARDFIPVAAFFFALSVYLNLPLYASAIRQDLKYGGKLHAPKDGRVDEMAAWLKSRLQKGDTVQPLDWTGGSIHAMLMARADVATRFMYDYHFYHHASDPLIGELRKEFIAQLAATRPRFIIKTEADHSLVTGLDSAESFPELELFLDGSYGIVQRGEGYVILELVRPGPSPTR